MLFIIEMEASYSKDVAHVPVQLSLRLELLCHWPL